MEHYKNLCMALIEKYGDDFEYGKFVVLDDIDIMQVDGRKTIEIEYVPEKMETQVKIVDTRKGR